jgi:hypothetical protein
MKINGWQRLWVVLAALWMLPVFWMTYALWPTSMDVVERDIENRMSPTNLSRLRSVDEPDPSLPSSGVTRSEPEPAGWSLVLERNIITPDGVTHHFPIEATLDQVQAALKSETHGRSGSEVSFSPEQVRPVTLPLAVSATVAVEGHRRLNFPEGTSENDMLRTAGEYNAVFWRILALNRATFVSEMAGWCALPAAVVYALGWAIGWVRRGFAG